MIAGFVAGSRRCSSQASSPAERHQPAPTRRSRLALYNGSACPLRSLRSFAALLATAVLGGVVAVGGVALLGLEGDTTVVTETVDSPNPSVPAGRGMTVNEIYERAASGVVQITSVGTNIGSAAAQQGSGFVLDKAGHIVTNYHVVRDADRIRVSFSNRDTVEARLVGTDPSTDVAVLQVDERECAHSASTGDSDRVQVGDPVVAIGNPFGLDRTATLNRARSSA